MDANTTRIKELEHALADARENSRMWAQRCHDLEQAKLRETPSAPKVGNIYSDAACVFNYCPSPDICQRSGGCVSPIAAKT